MRDWQIRDRFGVGRFGQIRPPGRFGRYFIRIREIRGSWIPPNAGRDKLSTINHRPAIKIQIWGFLGCGYPDKLWAMDLRCLAGGGLEKLLNRAIQIRNRAGGFGSESADRDKIIISERIREA